MSSATNRRSLIPAFLRDVRVLNFIGQVIFAIVLIAAVSAIWTSILNSLQSKNLTPNIDFLSNRAGFDISERPAWYSSNSSYAEAFRVGVENSLRIIGLGLVLTTIIGILGGIFLLSSNWLTRNITRGIVELLRNTPLLVQLIAWYFIVMLSLPLFEEALSIPQEGIVALPVRLLIEAVIVVGVAVAAWLSPRGSPRRALLWNGVVAAIIVLELSYRFFPGSFGQIGTPAGLLYVALSAGLCALVWARVRGAVRWQALGLAIGQGLAALLFWVGLIPQNSLGRIEVYPALLLSKRGLVFPEVVGTARFGGWALIVGIGLVVAVLWWIYLGRYSLRTGRPTRRMIVVPLLIALVVVGGWIAVGIPGVPSSIAVVQKDGSVKDMSRDEAVVAGVWTRALDTAYSQAPLLYIPPAQKISPAGIISGLVSGSVITPEYMALLIGLVVYTAAFIAEIVRAGILAVSHGQTEASHALGLTTPQTLGLIIMPQALRVIIPPLGNQYLNLSKNSSLAVSVAYADLVLVTQTIMNQSGQSVTGITMIMLTYLSISLFIAALINVVNRRFKIVTR